MVNIKAMIRDRNNAALDRDINRMNEEQVILDRDRKSGNFKKGLNKTKPNWATIDTFENDAYSQELLDSVTFKVDAPKSTEYGTGMAILNELNASKVKTDVALYPEICILDGDSDFKTGYKVMNKAIDIALRTLSDGATDEKAYNKLRSLVTKDKLLAESALTNPILERLININYRSEPGKKIISRAKFLYEMLLNKDSWSELPVETSVLDKPVVKPTTIVKSELEALIDSFAYADLTLSDLSLPEPDLMHKLKYGTLSNKRGYHLTSKARQAKKAFDLAGGESTAIDYINYFKEPIADTSIDAKTKMYFSDLLSLMDKMCFESESINYLNKAIDESSGNLKLLLDNYVTLGKDLSEDDKLALEAGLLGASLNLKLEEKIGSHLDYNLSHDDFMNFSNSKRGLYALAAQEVCLSAYSRNISDELLNEKTDYVMNRLGMNI